MKKLILTISFILFSALSYADVERVVESVATTDSLGGIYTTITVPTTTTVYTKAVSLKNHPTLAPVGVLYKASSSGAVALTIQAIQSHTKPSSETTLDATDQPFEGPVTTSDTGWHANTLDTVTMPYLRFKITGTGSNAASTTIQIKVSKE